MHFDLIQSISLAGSVGTANDDRGGAGETLAWVIDGATDLGPPGLVGARGGAAWLAAEAHAGFTAAADAPLATMCAGVADRLAAAYAAVRTREPEGRWELPIAAFLAVWLDRDTLECGWLGDCVGLLRSGRAVTRFGPVHEDRNAEMAHAEQLAQHGLGDFKRSAPILADLRASRERPGLPVLGVEPAAIARLETTRLPCTPGDDLLLMTDGFSAILDAYAMLEEAALMAALAVQGLAQLALKIRAIEADDAACTRYARFKRSDDATALWVRIAD